LESNLVHAYAENNKVRKALSIWSPLNEKKKEKV